MQRIYGWLKLVWEEKINVFIKGCFGGGIISGIFLFRGSVHDVSFFMLGVAYLLKLLAVGISGIVSGCATVLGTDLAKWVRGRFKKKKK